MQTSARVLALLAAAFARVDAEQADPIGQVIKLCEELSAKVRADGEAEAKAYNEYFEWCDDVSKEKQFEIKTATSQKEQLEAKIKELGADIEAGDSKIGELAEKISTNSADLKSATSIREKEAADFAASEKELVETVEVLGRAIGILEKELGAGSAAFAQISKNKNLLNAVQALSAIVDAASFSVSDKQRLTALIQAQQSSDADDEDMETGAPAGAVYESKSGGILDVLNDMQEKAESQLSELRKAEATAKGNYNVLKQGLTDQLANDNKEMDTQKKNKAANEEGKATAEGELSATVDDLKTSTSTLDDTQKTCMQVAADHEASIAARAEELKVIAEAIKIIKESTGAASFLQTAVEKKGFKSELVVKVKTLARKHHSAALAQLASRISAVMSFGNKVGDPFAKVKGLINDMIAKLEKEAQEEATEKAYCDEEMGKTEASKKDLEAEISKLSTSIDQASAKSTDLKEEVKTLQAELAAAAKEQSESDKVRQDDHAVYLEQKADLETALGGIRKALDLLQDYYASASASLIQDDAKFGAFMQQPAPPQGHSKSGGAGGSIINILQVAESDTATSLAKVEAEEADEAEAYEKATQEFKVTKAAKDQDVKYKTQEFTALDKTVTDLSGDRDSASTELAAVDEYYAKLQDRCVAKPEPYEERAKRREAEIAGLKEALTTLENEAALVQRGNKRHGHMRGSLTA